MLVIILKRRDPLIILVTVLSKPKIVVIYPLTRNSLYKRSHRLDLFWWSVQTTIPNSDVGCITPYIQRGHGLRNKTRHSWFKLTITEKDDFWYPGVIDVRPRGFKSPRLKAGDHLILGTELLTLPLSPPADRWDPRASAQELQPLKPTSS